MFGSTFTSITNSVGRYLSGFDSSSKPAPVQRFKTMPSTSQTSSSPTDFDVKRAKSLSTLSNMANNDVIVTVSGAALSMLFYENFRSNDNHIGFLLGNVHLYVTKNVTDMDREVEVKKKHIHINSVMSCPSIDKFHNSAGQVDPSKIVSYLNDKEKKIIGWFRLRKHRDLNLTFMDKILHKQFAEYFSNKFHFPSDEFIMCLLNISENSSKATHKYQSIFYRYRNRTMEPLPLKIHNLADDAANYKPGPVKSRNNTMDCLSEYIESHSSLLSKKSGLEAVGTIQKIAEEKLRQLCPELNKSEAQVTNLEERLVKMKKQIEFLERDCLDDSIDKNFDPLEQASTHNHCFDSSQKSLNPKSDEEKVNFMPEIVQEKIVARPKTLRNNRYSRRF